MGRSYGRKARRPSEEMCSMRHDTLAFVRGFTAIGVVIAVASCNYDWTYRPDGGTTPGTDKDAGADPNVPGADTGAPSTCARDKQDCPSGQYCYFADRACGTISAIGECRRAGIDCKNILACACDGTLGALTDCDAQSKGFDVDESGATCKTGTFACGATPCKSNAQACLTKSGGEPSCIDCTKCPCPSYEFCKCDDSTSGTVIVNCE